MNELYRSIGISKQSFHQQEDRYKASKSEEGQLLLLIYRIREDHPTMGVRDMYHKLSCPTMGRDSFERFCKLEGLVTKKTKSGKRTTDSSGVIRFENLLLNLVVSKINFDDLIIGDKNAIMIAARVLGYGKDYTFKYTNHYQP